jgi:hypothetical protein
MMIEIGELKLYTAEEVSHALGVQDTAVTAALEAGQMRGGKLGGRWYVSESQLSAYFGEDEEEPVDGRKLGYLLMLRDEIIGIRGKYDRDFVMAAQADGRFAWYRQPDSRYRDRGYWGIDYRACDLRGVDAIAAWELHAALGLVELADEYYQLTRIQICNGCQHCDIDAGFKCTNILAADRVSGNVAYADACEHYAPRTAVTEEEPG